MLRGVSVTDDVDWDYLVAHTELYSGDDIANVCRDASMMPLRREMLRGICDSEEQARQIQEKLRNVPISMQDFKEALATVKPTNSREKLDRYVKWMHEHGST
jgi:SpoVK/Ycf46/Vps4 family AAA+-type ATPase